MLSCIFSGTKHNLKHLKFTQKVILQSKLSVIFDRESGLPRSYRSDTKIIQNFFLKYVVPFPYRLRQYFDKDIGFATYTTILLCALPKHNSSPKQEPQKKFCRKMIIVLKRSSYLSAAFFAQSSWLRVEKWLWQALLRWL